MLVDRDGHSYISWTYRCPETRAPNLHQWLVRKDAPEELYELSRFRLAETLDNTSEVAFSILMKPEYQALRLYIERALGCTTWLLTDFGTGQSVEAFNHTHTHGECAWKEDGEKQCAHHDRPTAKMWVLIKGKYGSGYDQLWSREKGEASVQVGWNSDQVRSTLGFSGGDQLSVDRVVMWDKVSRSLGQSIEQKKVIKAINEALRRMSGRNMNVVTKEGLRNTATYNWKEWGWLTEMQAWVAQTSKKNRKEGDLVNGWVYTKYDVRMSYGHEIAKFKWVPENSQKTYYVNVEGSGYYSRASMPFRFAEKVKAMQYKQFLNMMEVKSGAPNYNSREWDADAGAEKVDGSSAFAVRSDTHIMEMNALQDPEYLPNPETILQALMFGTPQDYDEHIQHLNEQTQRNFNKPHIKEGEA